METKPEKLQVVARVIRDGRITLPKSVRDTLGIKDGDKVLVDIVKIAD